MDIKSYLERDWQRESIVEHFDTVSKISAFIMEDRKRKMRQGILDECLDYSTEIRFMTGLMNNLSYSDNFGCTVKAAAIASAESILLDPFITKERRRWSEIKNNKGALHSVARVAQKHMDKAIARYDFFGDYDRITEIIITNKKPRICFDRNKRILHGVMHSTSIPPSSNTHRIVGPTQFETLTLNMHPESKVHDPIEWLGVEYHEKGHGMEYIAGRHYMGTSEEKSNDGQLLVHKRKVRMHEDFRDLFYEVYEASPSERLVRMGQAVFVNRMRQGMRLAA